MTEMCKSSTPEYLREKCKRFYHARKLRDPEAHKAKQNRNGKAWKLRNRPKVREYSARKRASNPEYYTLACKKSRERLRVKVLGAYGSVCPCGEARLEALTIDHVGGWGKKHRQEAGTDILRLVRNDGYPDVYRVLCRNCNMRDQFERRRAQGFCPL